MAGTKVLGILAGNDAPVQTLANWGESADFVVAADGAANGLLASGIRLDAIIGDLDSLDPIIRDSKVTIIELPDQESTDCDKLLAFVRARFQDCNLWIGGMEGDRFDHVLSSLHSIAQAAPHARLLLRDGVGCFVTPDLKLSQESVPNQIVSMIPLLPCEGLVVKGLQWPPKSNLTPAQSISISNQATGTQVEASVTSGIVLAIFQADTSIPSWT